MALWRILVVEHDPRLARELASMLGAFGHEVAGIAASGREAIAVAEGRVPDLALVDLALAGELSGIETARELRWRWPIPVIFLTAATDDATLTGAGVTQPYEWVAKPIVERELRLVVDLALGKHAAARQLLEFEGRFFDVSVDMLCCLDFNGYFKRLNRAWERTLGFTRAELMSHPFIEFVHPDDRERTLKQNAEVRSGGRALGFENRYLCKDGSHRWFLWNAAPDPGERVIYSVARDITVRKQAESDRERLVEELRSALAEVRVLQEILPICSYCRKIRDDENYWHSVESYVAQHTNSRFSHSICPSCFTSIVEPLLREEKRE